MATKTIDTDLSVVGKVSQSGTPSASGDLTTKTYVDSVVTATNKHVLVRVIATANVTLASAVENGDTLDGITLATGDLVLLPLQTTATENGIYVVNATGAPTRHSDFDASGDLTVGTEVRSKAGTANGGNLFLMSAQGATPWVPGSSTSTWVKQLNAGPPYIPGSTDVSAVDGGTGRSSHTTYQPILGGTSTTSAQQSMGTQTTAGKIIRGAGDAAVPTWVETPVEIAVALGDEATAITTTGTKVTMRAPWAFTVTAVRASVSVASSSGIVTVDINDGGTTILSTKLTIDATEKTSVTAATAAVISDTAIADDAEITFDVDVTGTGAKGLKVVIYGTRLI